jgi:hypothetical protein
MNDDTLDLLSLYLIVGDIDRKTQLHAIELIELNPIRPDTPAKVCRRAEDAVTELRAVDWARSLRERGLRAIDRLEQQLNKKKRDRAAARALTNSKKKQARLDARAAELAALGVPWSRATVLSSLKEGPFDVVLHGMRKTLDDEAFCSALARIGYSADESKRMLRRAMHIGEPQVLAYLVDEDPAIGLKIRVEKAGAIVRIKRHERRK